MWSKQEDTVEDGRSGRSDTRLSEGHAVDPGTLLAGRCWEAGDSGGGGEVSGPSPNAVPPADGSEELEPFATA